jgi:hypothetical protein
MLIHHFITNEVINIKFLYKECCLALLRGFVGKLDGSYEIPSFH